MGKRDEERKNSLDVLARIARGSSGPAIPPKRDEPDERARKAQRGPAPEPRPAPASAPAPRARGSPLEGKAAERAEREVWRKRREAEMARAQGITRPPPPPTPAERVHHDKQRAARARLEERRARQESLRQLQEQRQRDLQRGANIGETRGPWMKPMDYDPQKGRQIRKTPPSLQEKMGKVLGEDADSRTAWQARQETKRERAGKQRERRGRGR